MLTLHDDIALSLTTEMLLIKFDSDIYHFYIAVRFMFQLYANESLFEVPVKDQSNRISGMYDVFA